MKILFSNPPWWEREARGGALRIGIRAGSRWPFSRQTVHAPDTFRFGGYLPFPFFLGYAASNTQRRLPDATVLMRDSIARGESANEFFIYLSQEKPDWIVIETATPSWQYDQLVLQELAAGRPEAKIILAGPLDAKQAPQILSDHPNVAAIVQGEFDKQIAKVVIGGARGLVPHDQLTEAEMNAAPAPMFDEAAALHYWDGCPAGQQAPQLQVWSSRGCPFKCIFCVWPATMTGNDPDGTRPRSVRFYSREYMESFLRDRLARAAAAGVLYRSIYFDDDTFNLSNDHVLNMCEVMRGIGLPWSAMCRADTIRQDTWRAMRDAGCFGVKLGFESGSQQVIDTIINKRLDLAAALKTAYWLRAELGMTVHGTFTIGLPGETAAQQEETRDFIARAYAIGAIDTHQLSGTAEIEGTPLHTLTHGQSSLKKYPGAHVDGNYQASADGQRKIESMR